MRGGRGARAQIGVAGTHVPPRPLVLPGFETARRFAGTCGGWLADALRREAAAFDLTLVVPVFMGVGVAAYFAAPEEPGLLAPLALLGVFGGLAIWMRARWWLYVGLVCLAATAAGFALAKIRTLSVDGPQIARPLTAKIIGVVLDIEARQKGGARFVMRPVSVEGLDAATMPLRIRLTVRDAGDLAAGDSISLKALMQPPPPPAVPGGYDFARDAFFHGIGAVGFVAGKIAPAPEPVAMTWSERFHAGLDRTRNRLTARIVSVIGGEDGAVAASQVTGKRGFIPDDANTALRASGLYHVVSISGLHMALFAGGLFWVIRALLALSTRLALTRPLKNLAAILALAPAAAYTLFSGAEVATVRSFIMTGIVLLAVAMGRSAVTRRNVALSAVYVLATTPDEMLGPSFQMSFAAVAMLVAWVDRPHKPESRPPGLAWERRLRHALHIFLAMLGTTLIASLATAPFSSFHFHRVTMQSIVSNLAATPIVELLIMPLSLLALVAEPFGYGAPVWQAVGVSVHWFMEIARIVASWPGADLVMPQFSSATLLAFVAALLIFALLRTKLVFAASLPVLIGVVGAFTTERPMAIIGANGRAAIIRDGDNLTLMADRRDAFAAKEWLLAMGDRRLPTDPLLKADARCDSEGCSAPLGDGSWLMLDHTPDAIEEDCRQDAFHVAILVAPLTIPASCTPDMLTLDRSRVVGAGTIDVYAGNTPGDWRIVTARGETESRPWAPRVPPPVAIVPADTDAPLPSPAVPDPEDQ